MHGSSELKLENFFASRAGVCVYVMVGRRSYRVQFVDANAEGVVVEGGREGAEAARQVARRAMREHAAGLARLFEKVARAMT
jgi:hypothetical protein